jgi:hypothetical protein
MLSYDYLESRYPKRGPVRVECLVQKKAAAPVQECLIDLDNNIYHSYKAGFFSFLYRPG